MKLLVDLVSLYFTIGAVVAAVALARSDTAPFDLWSDNEPVTSILGTIALWPLSLFAEWDVLQRRRRLNQGPIRTDWVTKGLSVPKDWIATKVAGSPDDLDWHASGERPRRDSGVQELLDMMIPGDELWWFSSRDDSWRKLAGRAGYVLLREGKQIAHLTTLMN